MGGDTRTRSGEELVEVACCACAREMAAAAVARASARDDGGFFNSINVLTISSLKNEHVEVKSLFDSKMFMTLQVMR